MNVGLVGLGRAGLYLRERLSLRDDLCVVACHDSSPSVRQNFRGDGITCCETLSQLLADPQIEAMWIATPPASHFELANAALRAGRHVVVEPPLTLTEEEGERLGSLAIDTGRSLIVAHTRRGDDDFQQAFQAVRSGDLGNLLSLRLTCWQYSPPQLRGQPGGATWRDDPASGGGVLWELGTHFIDQLLQLQTAALQSVYARVTAAGGELAEGFLAVINFAGGAVATLDVSRSALIPRTSGWEINGSRGCIASGVLYTATSEGEVEDVPTPVLSADTDWFYSAVVRHLRESGPNPVPGSEAIRVVRLIEAIHQSAACGQAVTLKDRA